MFKKFFIFCLFNLLFNQFALANLEIKARTAILQDFLSGEILYEKDSDRSIYPASMTKIMTSIIAFDLVNKKILWTFQDVIHDLWDFDLSSPPILANLKYNNNFIESVIITSKIGNTFIFERKTGQSFFDINYKKAPISNVPNEKTSNLQRA